MGLLGGIKNIKNHSELVKKISKIISEMKCNALDAARKYDSSLSIDETRSFGITSTEEEKENGGGKLHIEVEDIPVTFRDKKFKEILDSSNSSKSSSSYVKKDKIFVVLFYSSLQSAIEKERDLYKSRHSSSSSFTTSSSSFSSSSSPSFTSSSPPTTSYSYSHSHPFLNSQLSTTIESSTCRSSSSMISNPKASLILKADESQRQIKAIIEILGIYDVLLDYISGFLP